MLYRAPKIPIKGWMNITELQWLYNQAKKHKTIVEIGSWKGRSSHALLSGALKGGGQVTCIDHFQGTEILRSQCFQEVPNLDVYHLFMANVGHFPNLTVLKMSSDEAASKVNSIEMTFIDGDHTTEQAKKDIETWLPKTTKLLCGHDYNFPEVKKAVVDTMGLPKIMDTIWYFNLGEE